MNNDHQIIYEDKKYVVAMPYEGAATVYRIVKNKQIAKGLMLIGLGRNKDTYMFSVKVR
jgi:hypothetical protein